MLEVLPLLNKEPVLGFDTETRPAFRKGQVFRPSLLQLGGAETVYLFQLQMLTQLDRLFAVLEKPNVLKVGVAMGFDIRKLQEMCPFEPHGFVDLEALTDSVGIEHNGFTQVDCYRAWIFGYPKEPNARIGRKRNSHKNKLPMLPPMPG